MKKTSKTSDKRSKKSGDQKTVWILVNFGKDVETVTLPGQMTDVLGSGRVGSVKLDPYGVSVLSKE